MTRFLDPAGEIHWFLLPCFHDGGTETTEEKHCFREETLPIPGSRITAQTVGCEVQTQFHPHLAP